MTKQKIAFGFFTFLFMSTLLLFIAAYQHVPKNIDVRKLTPHCAHAMTQLKTTIISTDDNCTIRHWYNKTLQSIPTLLAPNDNTKEQLTTPSTLHQQALCAYSVRFQARLTARNAMSKYEVAVLRIRDLFTYGHFDGPTFKQLVTNTGDMAYKKVIASSQRSYKKVDQVCNL